ncbi:pantoate--beta-alanine ligase [Aureisphaera galaxeae]|uniref:pantoate--beta-alanine ligase n=1 Tax=Aureisphaera galaxeae TaxID=1538023 RepID=UPI0030100EA0
MIYHQQEILRKELDSFSQKKQSVGFVPTMGALHEGHLSLVEKALSENEVVVVSIFVNPTQFDNASDLEKYPRTLKADAQLLNTLKGTIFIYAPNVADLYGETVISKKYNFGGLEHAMEGKYRTGHFDGVGTVLNLLFRALQPTRAYFGEKDFQQLQIVRRLVAIEQLPVTVVGCPILRESHGLAMSSRNQRLTATQFKEADLIYKTLKKVREHFLEESIPTLQAMAEGIFAESAHLELEYFEIANIENLKTARRKRKGNSYRAFVAAYAGEIRLIDNMELPKI